MNLRIRIIILFVELLLCYVSISAQYMVTKLLRKEDGLIQNETHGVRIAPDGILHIHHHSIAHSTFDGEKFINILSSQTAKYNSGAWSKVNSKGELILQVDSGIYIIKMIILNLDILENISKAYTFVLIHTLLIF